MSVLAKLKDALDIEIELEEYETKEFCEVRTQIPIGTLYTVLSKAEVMGLAVELLGIADKMKTVKL